MTRITVFMISTLLITSISGVALAGSSAVSQVSGVASKLSKTNLDAVKKKKANVTGFSQAKKQTPKINH